MGIAVSIVELLKRERIPYTWFQHKASYTAQEEAAASHILGRSWAKVVICIADEQPVQAVLPAHFAVDLEHLRAIAGVMTLRLATEEELARLYPDWEVGAMPPFGAVFGHRVFVERCLVGEPEMVFNAGTHTDAIRMHYWDFAELAKPVVGNFCRTPGGQLTTCASPHRKGRQTKLES
jgi:Ala-tRNA(Pro) deacylase